MKQRGWGGSECFHNSIFFNKGAVKNSVKKDFRGGGGSDRCMKLFHKKMISFKDGSKELHWFPYTQSRSSLIILNL